MRHILVLVLWRRVLGYACYEVSLLKPLSGARRCSLRRGADPDPLAASPLRRPPSVKLESPARRISSRPWRERVCGGVGQPGSASLERVACGRAGADAEEVGTLAGQGGSVCRASRKIRYMNASGM